VGNQPSCPICKLLRLSSSGYSIIIAPSQRRDGTNAFYQTPPNLIQVWYGINSFQKNLELIKQRPVRYKVLQQSAFALDIDLKEDLETLKQLCVETITSQFIKTLSL
jgi:2-phospho-L-lactate guanylyltransferase (CobY/MobA/RfbA family)